MIRKRCGGDRGGAGRQNDMAGGRGGDMGGIGLSSGGGRWNATGGVPRTDMVWGFRVVRKTVFMRAAFGGM